MPETLLTFQRPVVGPNGTEYEARACGRESPGGTWEGWIEFLPLDGADPVRSSRETTQPNRTDTEYWATGLTPVYLEGALRRALQGPPRPTRVVGHRPSLFAEPAPSLAPRDVERPGVLNPFVAFQKGESLLRKQLGALSAWHLVNIVLEYELTTVDAVTLKHMSASALAELIISAVREQAVREQNVSKRIVKAPRSATADHD